MLALLRHPQQLATNPIAQAEYAYLQRRENDWWGWARYLVFALLVPVAILPLWLYIDDTQTVILLGMIVIIYGTHFLIGLRTLLLAVNAINREQHTSAWDSLILTGVDARQIVWGKWWGVVRYVWKDHVLFALLRVGLAFGIAQYLNFIWLALDYGSYNGTLSCPYHIPFCYSSGTGHTNPQILTTILGVFIVAIYAVVEAKLLVALGIVVGLALQRKNNLNVFGAIFLRGLLTIASIVSFDQLARLDIEPVFKIYCDWHPDCEWIARYDWRSSSNSHLSVSLVRTSLYQVRKTLLIALSPVADDSTLLVANLMRPTIYGGRWFRFDPPLSDLDENWGVNFLNYLPFILRNIISAYWGLGLYNLLIALSLRLAQIAAVRRCNALRPATE